MGASASRCDAKEQSSLPPPPAAPPLPAEGSGGGGDGSKGSGGGSGGDKSIEEAAAAVSAYGNPGMWENLANEAKRLVFVDTFDGARLDVSKQLSPMMMVNHNVWLGTSMLPGGDRFLRALRNVKEDTWEHLAPLLYGPRKNRRFAEDGILVLP